MGVAWPPRPAAVAPASAPARTEAARPPTPRDCPCPVDTALTPRPGFSLPFYQPCDPHRPYPPACPPFPWGQEGGGGDSSEGGPGRTDCLSCSLGGRQGQCRELSEDPWSWASGRSLGALRSSRQPSAPLATSSSPANARTWLPHTQNPQAIAPLSGNPPCLGW